ncbi:MAG: hypothetical protein ACOYM7_08625 [Paludibacter sp.]
MTNQVSLDIKKLDDSFKLLINHPYTAMQLVDKEKFHTGLFGFTCKIIPVFLYKLIGVDHSGKIETIFEQESVDLIVKIGKEMIAVFEMKLKTTVHNKSGTTINQLEATSVKIQKKAKDKVTPLFLVTLFETDEGEKWGWKNITYKKIADTLYEILEVPPSNIDKDYIALISLWHKYLNALVEISTYVFNAGNESIEFENLENPLEKIKLKGIFEDYRANRVLKLIPNTEDKETKKHYLKTDNSHGHGLLDVALLDYEYRFGLQWQRNVLKLFAELISPDKNQEDRDRFLKKLGGYLKKEYDQNINVILNQENKEVKFRSITIKGNWSFFSNLNGSSNELKNILIHLKKFDPKKY